MDQNRGYGKYACLKIFYFFYMNKVINKKSKTGLAIQGTAFVNYILAANSKTVKVKNK